MKINSWHVGIAAEAIAAGQFARCGYDVSVQYGANQPEYDLIVARRNGLMKISVKGSQDGAWGLTQSFKKGRTYFECSQAWLDAHSDETIFCLVQFKNADLDAMPKIHLALPREIKERLDRSRGGRGETILYEHHEWRSGIAAGKIDEIPAHWKFSTERIEELFAAIK